MDKTFRQFQEHYLSKTLKLHWNSRQGKQKKTLEVRSEALVYS